MKVPLLDLKEQYSKIRDEIMAVTEEVYKSQQFILGDKVLEFEDKIAKYCGAKFGIGVSSGTDALLIALMASEIGQGDIVITTPYSFFATAGSIARLGAKPVFADIDSETLNISPASIRACLKNLSKQELKRTKAIMPVHLFGLCAEMDQIHDIAKEYGLIIIEDAAQSIGSDFKGKKSGAIGDMGCFSFFPSKNLGGFGDGGMVVTGSQAFYEKIVSLRNHGAKPKYIHSFIGGNFRLDALQAAVLSVKLKYLESWTLNRIENAKRYKTLFNELGLGDLIGTSPETENRHVYNQFVIMGKDRDKLRDYLSDAGIGTEIYYPSPLHLQPCFSYLGLKKGDFPIAEEAASKALALPVYPELSVSAQKYIAEKIKEFYG